MNARLKSGVRLAAIIFTFVLLDGQVAYLKASTTEGATTTSTKPAGTSDATREPKRRRVDSTDDAGDDKKVQDGQEWLVLGFSDLRIEETGQLRAPGYTAIAKALAGDSYRTYSSLSCCLAAPSADLDAKLRACLECATHIVFNCRDVDHTRFQPGFSFAEASSWTNMELTFLYSRTVYPQQQPKVVLWIDNPPTTVWQETEGGEDAQVRKWWTMKAEAQAWCHETIAATIQAIY